MLLAFSLPQQWTPIPRKIQQLGHIEMTKRLFDFVLSSIGLVVLSPFLSVISFLIWREGNGPIFYRGRRVGYQGKIFHIFKFRTMVHNADKIGGPSTADDDPRITKIGKYLRKYKADEMPQLINILKGEMSFVGPRPEVLQEVNLYTEKERELLKVRPGITDYASLRFHNEGEILKGKKDPHEVYRRLIRPEKVRLGLEYVHTQSLVRDLTILMKTFKTLLVTRMK